MRGVNLTDLAALPNDANLVALAEIDPTEWNAHRKRLQAGLNSALTGLQDLESQYAGSGEPIRKVQGKRYYDSDADLWKLYRSAAGTPVILLDAAKGYSQSLVNAGTATAKLGGAVDVNTAQVSRGSGGGTLQTYALPANTLSVNLQVLAGIIFGTSNGAGGVQTFVSRFGGTILGQLGMPAAATRFAAKSYVVRNSATGQKAGSFGKMNRDDGGITGNSFNATPALDLTAAVTVDSTIGVLGGVGTLTGEIMATRLLP